MANTLGAPLKPRTSTLRMPMKGLASWRHLRLVFSQFLKGTRYKLSVEGAEQMEQTSDGLRVKIVPQSGSAPISIGADNLADEYSGWEPEPGDCGCGDDPQFWIRKTVVCGRAMCCGDPLPSEGEDLPAGTAALLTTTQECTLLDYTDGPLTTYACTRTIVQDLSVETNGTAAGPCPNVPDCGTGTLHVEGCEDAPLCSGPPEPGFKCYTVNDSAVERSKLCYYADLAAAAIGAGEATVDPFFTNNLNEMILSSSFLAASGGVYTASRCSWEIQRRGKRKPGKLIIEITQGAEVYEEEVTFDAMTNTGVFQLDLPPLDETATITNVTAIYGRPPEP